MCVLPLFVLPGIVTEWDLEIVDVPPTITVVQFSFGEPHPPACQPGCLPGCSLVACQSASAAPQQRLATLPTTVSTCPHASLPSLPPSWPLRNTHIYSPLSPAAPTHLLCPAATALPCRQDTRGEVHGHGSDQLGAVCRPARHAAAVAHVQRRRWAVPVPGALLLPARPPACLQVVCFSGWRACVASDGGCSRGTAGLPACLPARTAAALGRAPARPSRPASGARLPGWPGLQGTKGEAEAALTAEGIVGAGAKFPVKGLTYKEMSWIESVIFMACG